MAGSGGSPFNYSARADDPRRRGKRHETDLQSNLGAVLDLSKVGMRVACKGKPELKVGETTKIRLQIPEGNLNLKGRAVWVKRIGFRAFHMGVEFVDTSRSIMTALEKIAEFGFLGLGDAGSTTTSERQPAAIFGGGAAAAGSTTSRGRGTATRDPNMPDHYKALQIGRHASAQQIRDAFRRLAREYHPDVSDDPQAAEKFHKVHEAYEVLKDPDQRKVYDLKLAG
jgi:hypothetical protein